MDILSQIRKTIPIKKDSYPYVILVTSIIAAILIAYWQDLSILANEALQSESVGHVLLIPFLIAYLLYRKKELVKASIALERLKEKTELVSFSDIVGVAFCILAFLLYWYGSYTFYALEYHIISLPLFVIGVILILFNMRTLRVLIFPILFLLFLVPPPSTITYTAGAILANFHTQASYTLLRAFGLNVELETSYGAPTMVLKTASQSPISFAVDVPCSGIYSLIAFIMFAVFVSYIIRGSFIKKTTLFLTGFLILQVLNIVRISSIVLVANWLGEEIAMNFFHLVTGWVLIFIGILVLLLMAEKLWKMRIFTRSSESSSCPQCEESSEKKQEFCTGCGAFLKTLSIKIPDRFWIKIGALLLACYLVTFSLQTPVFALAQAPEALTIESPSTQGTSTGIFPEIPGYQLQFVYRDIQYEMIAHQDASLVYAYLPTDISDPTVWVDVGVASSVTNLHSWEVCLVTWQTAQGKFPMVAVLNSRDVQLMENPLIIARFFNFQKEANYVQITLYWYGKALFKNALTVEQKYVRISLLTFMGLDGDSARLEEKLLAFGREIAAYWEPLKAQSIVSLGIPTLQVLLASTIIFAIVAQATQYTRDWRRKRTNLKIFEKLASPAEKQLYQTIKDLSQNTKETTIKNIAAAFEKNAGNSVKPNELVGMLNDLRKHKIIEADVINTLDQSRLVWKP